MFQFIVQTANEVKPNLGTKINLMVGHSPLKNQKSVDKLKFLFGAQSLVAGQIRVDTSEQLRVKHPITAVVLLDGKQPGAFRILTLVVPGKAHTSSTVCVCIAERGVSCKWLHYSVRRPHWLNKL